MDDPHSGTSHLHRKRVVARVLGRLTGRIVPVGPLRLAVNRTVLVDPGKSTENEYGRTVVGVIFPRTAVRPWPLSRTRAIDLLHGYSALVRSNGSHG